MTQVSDCIRLQPRWLCEKWDMPEGSRLLEQKELFSRSVADARKKFLREFRDGYTFNDNTRDLVIVRDEKELIPSPTLMKRMGFDPTGRHVVEGNLALEAGLRAMCDLFAGLASPNPWNNANARLFVGNSNTAPVASQTNLQGVSTLEKAMDVGYPSRTNQTLYWKSTFASGEANFAWEEGGVKNGAGAPNGTTVILFNRRVLSLGTKLVGAVWTLTLDITFS